MHAVSFGVWLYIYQLYVTINGHYNGVPMWLYLRVHAMLDFSVAAL